jgi:hypothetical protein
MTRFKIAASLSAVTDDVLVFHFGPASSSKSKAVSIFPSQALNLIALFWARVSPQPFDELLFLL